jgi:hypothetical protein
VKETIVSSQACALVTKKLGHPCPACQTKERVYTCIAFSITAVTRTTFTTRKVVKVVASTVATFRVAKVVSVQAVVQTTFNPYRPINNKWPKASFSCQLAEGLSVQRVVARPSASEQAPL